jgi:hypothetical protein
MAPIVKSTKGFALCHALARALSSVRLQRFRLGLTEDQRFEIAEAAVQRLQDDGRWPELNEESGTLPLAPTSKAGPHQVWMLGRIKIARGIV